VHVLSSYIRHNIMSSQSARIRFKLPAGKIFRPHELRCDPRGVLNESNKESLILNRLRAKSSSQSVQDPGHRQFIMISMPALFNQGDEWHRVPRPCPSRSITIGRQFAAEGNIGGTVQWVLGGKRERSNSFCLCHGVIGVIDSNFLPCH
jgi:hypothetical protein